MLHAKKRVIMHAQMRMCVRKHEGRRRNSLLLPSLRTSHAKKNLQSLPFCLFFFSNFERKLCVWKERSKMRNENELPQREKKELPIFKRLNNGRWWTWGARTVEFIFFSELYVALYFPLCMNWNWGIMNHGFTLSHTVIFTLFHDFDCGCQMY